MQDLVSVSDFEKFLDTNSKNIGLNTVNLEDARFRFVNQPVPSMTIGGNTYLLQSKWVIKQLCKLIGISEKFYKNCPTDLCENVFNTHIHLVDETKRQVQLNYYEDSGNLYLRGILNSKYFSLTNREVFGLIKDHAGFGAVEGVVRKEGGQVFDELLTYKVVLAETYEMSGSTYHKGYLVKSSELEASKLMITPVLVHSESSAIIPLTVKGKPVLNASYVNPANGTLLPLINGCLTISDTYFKDMITTINGEYTQDITYPVVYEKLADWETRRDIPKSVVKKSRKTIDALDADDTIGCVGDLCSVVLEESLGSFNKEFKVGKFVGTQLGFFVEKSEENAG